MPGGRTLAPGEDLRVRSDGQQESGQKQPLFCIGESSGLEQRYSGMITGIFFFPRFLVEVAGRALLRQ